ncbi:DNA polymerase alpha subunit B [Cichlidogyrus casuarinus]|uniref:DNA polymerase alpha subunit B n=1 Tax=Cichlidogyrus casuarinus TaxID=1844966 RepID=A0ABD2Q988_9PLAT
MAEAEIYGEIKEELSDFGINVENNDCLVLTIGAENSLNTTSLVAKFVAFHRNNKFGDKISKEIIDQFKKKCFADQDNKTKNLKSTPNSALKPKNALTNEMRQDLLAFESADSQLNILASYSNKKIDDNLAKRISTTPVSDAKRTRGALSRVPLAELEEFSKSLNDWICSTLNRVLENFVLENESIEECTQSQMSFSSLMSQNESLSGSTQEDKPGSTQEDKPGISNLTSVSKRSQKPVLIGGRVSVFKEFGHKSVKNENSTQSLPQATKLTRTNVAIMGIPLIEGSLGGRLVLMDLTSLTDYSFHPGQPILVKASNSSGRMLNILENVTIPRLPLVELSQSLLENDVSAFDVMVFAGPFTCSSSKLDDTSVLCDILRLVKQRSPQLVIFVGPFIDANHPQMESYKDRSFSDLFEYFLDTVAEYCFHVRNLQVLVVPSYREVTGHSVYPTPPYKVTVDPRSERAQWYSGSRLHFSWDPCFVRLGPKQVQLAISSVDLLMHLSGDEISGPTTNGDRMTRLCSQITSLGSMYPINPPNIDLPLDYMLWSEVANFDRNSQLYIVPSSLRQFAKVCSHSHLDWNNSIGCRRCGIRQPWIVCERPQYWNFCCHSDWRIPNFKDGELVTQQNCTF